MKKSAIIFSLFTAMLLSAVVGAFAYVQRDPILVRYHTHRYFAQNEPDVESEEWLLSHELLALPVALRSLSETEDAPCERAGRLIRTILNDHADPTNPEDSHISLAVAAKLNERYGNLSIPGRFQAVTIAATILKQHLDVWSPNTPTALETAGNVFLRGLTDEDMITREQTLAVVPVVWTWTGTDGAATPLVSDWKSKCYSRTVDLLRSESERIRESACRALVGAPFHEGDFELIGLLDDVEHAVQKAALLALAHSAADSLSSEHKTRLIEFLNDTDHEVREAARQLLQKSGVSEAVIHMATLMKADDPSQRAEVVSLAFKVADVDPVVWLTELSNDPSPVVRLAVARASADRIDDEGLKQILHQLAESDEDATVREMSKQLIAIQLADKSK